MNQPVTTARVVYPYQTLAQTCPSLSTSGCPGIGWKFPPATTSITAGAGSSVIVLTGNAQTIPAYPTLTALVVRVEGAVRVATAGVTCSLTLVVPAIHRPHPTPSHPPSIVQSTNSSPTGSNQPFVVDAVLPISAGVAFSLGTIELQLQANGSGSCSSRPRPRVARPRRLRVYGIHHEGVCAGVQPMTHSKEASH